MAKVKLNILSVIEINTIACDFYNRLWNFLVNCNDNGSPRVGQQQASKKAIGLTIARCILSYVDEALRKDIASQNHSGGNVYCTVKKENPCIDSQQFWRPGYYEGIVLQTGEYQRLKEWVPNIQNSAPSLTALFKVIRPTSCII